MPLSIQTMQCEDAAAVVVVAALLTSIQTILSTLAYLLSSAYFHVSASGLPIDPIDAKQKIT